ncbi:MAG: serine hydrolase [Anaerolineae bacterium]|nr:serine hydrolase [Gemmatimonadaceae bacterium]
MNVSIVTALYRQTNFRRLAAALGLLLAAGPTASFAQTASAAPNGFPAELDAYIAKAVKDWEVPGLSIAIVRNDSVIVVKGYGVREMGKPGKVDQNTVFDAASLTKSFTATATAMLVDEGKMRWDDPVKRHLPQVRFMDSYLTENLTIRDLLAHRSGLEPANFSWRFTGIDRAELIRRTPFLKVAAPFRTQMIYSNVGYTLAGEAAASAAGTTWEALVRDRIVKPLGMNSAVVSYAAVERMPNVASPHAVIDAVQRPIRREGIGRQANAPAGAVQATAEDLSRWLRFHLGDGTWEGRRLVSEAAMQEMHSPQIIIPTTPAFRTARLVNFFAAYGFGFQVMDYRGRAMLWHSGGGDGQLAYMALLPNEKIGVAVLVNSWIAPVIHGMLAGRVLDTYLGITPPSDGSATGLEGRAAQQQRTRDARKAVRDGLVPGSAPARSLSAYAGVYADSLYGELTVRVERGSLVLRMGREAADLAHRSADTFLVRWRDPVFDELYTNNGTFAEGAGGVVDAFTMRLNRDTVSVRRVAGR